MIAGSATVNRPSAAGVNRRVNHCAYLASSGRHAASSRLIQRMITT